MVRLRRRKPRRHISGGDCLSVRADILILVSGVGGHGQGVGPLLGDVQVSWARAGAGHRVAGAGAQCTINVCSRGGVGILSQTSEYTFSSPLMTDNTHQIFPK